MWLVIYLLLRLYVYINTFFINIIFYFFSALRVTFPSFDWFIYHCASCSRHIIYNNNIIQQSWKQSVRIIYVLIFYLSLLFFIYHFEPVDMNIINTLCPIRVHYWLTLWEFRFIQYILHIIIIIMYTSTTTLLVRALVYIPITHRDRTDVVAAAAPPPPRRRGYGNGFMARLQKRIAAVVVCIHVYALENLWKRICRVFILAPARAYTLYSSGLYFWERVINKSHNCTRERLCMYVSYARVCSRLCECACVRAFPRECASAFGKRDIFRRAAGVRIVSRCMYDMCTKIVSARLLCNRNVPTYLVFPKCSCSTYIYYIPPAYEWPPAVSWRSCTCTHTLHYICANIGLAGATHKPIYIASVI